MGGLTTGPEGANEKNGRRSNVATTFGSEKLENLHLRRFVLARDDSNATTVPKRAPNAYPQSVDTLAKCVQLRLRERLEVAVCPHSASRLMGMRRTEYLAATKAHLLPDVHGVKIPATEADSSTETVYVDEKLWHWIEAGIPAPLRYKWLRIHWKRACEEAGVPDLRFQDLRHALAQWAMEAGVPLNEVMALLRHEKLETTAIYLKTIAKKNAAKVLGDVVATNEKRRAKKKKKASPGVGRQQRAARRSAATQRAVLGQRGPRKSP